MTCVQLWATQYKMVLDQNGQNGTLSRFSQDLSDVAYYKSLLERGKSNFSSQNFTGLVVCYKFLSGSCETRDANAKAHVSVTHHYLLSGMVLKGGSRNAELGLFPLTVMKYVFIVLRGLSRQKGVLGEWLVTGKRSKLPS